MGKLWGFRVVTLAALWEMDCKGMREETGPINDQAIGKKGLPCRWSLVNKG